MHLVGVAEEGDPAHPVQVLADDEQRHRHAADGQLAERRQPGIRRRLADDAEFPAEPVRQVVPQRMRHPGTPSMTNRTGIGAGNRPRPTGEALIRSPSALMAEHREPRAGTVRAAFAGELGARF